jgi:hypothetical protein
MGHYNQEKKNSGDVNKNNNKRDIRHRVSP